MLLNTVVSLLIILLVILIVEYLTGLIYIFPLLFDWFKFIKYLDTSFWLIPCSSLLSVFARFSTFFVLVSIIFLNILDISYLGVIFVANIFFSVAFLLFIPLIGPLHKQNSLVFILLFSFLFQGFCVPFIPNS